MRIRDEKEAGFCNPDRRDVGGGLEGTEGLGPALLCSGSSY